MIFKKENIDTNIKKKLKYFTLKRDINIYIELILNMFSTTEIESFLAKKTTLSSFWNIKFDLGIITLLSRKTAPILISSGRFEFFNSLLINSDVSIISASITSYSQRNYWDCLHYPRWWVWSYRGWDYRNLRIN